MEKFAIDLDRVLDEFEFNEDCAEQVALSTDCKNPWTPSLIKSSSERSLNFTQSTSSDVVPSTRQDRYSLSDKTLELQQLDENISSADASGINETFDTTKVDPEQENSDSINDFYNRGRSVNDKVQQKRFVNFRDDEPVSLTIHNDISQKLVQKQKNESGPVGTKNHNSYDKKLNQPNIKPSVSNVFSSLNDYINAPSGNIEQNKNSVVGHEGSGVKATSEINIIGQIDEIVNGEDSSSAAVFSTDGIISDPSVVSQMGETSSTDNSISATTKYQNILLPVKFDSNASFGKKHELGGVQSLAEGINLESMTEGHFGITSNSERISQDTQNTYDIVTVNSNVDVNSGTKMRQESLCKDREPRLPSVSIKMGVNQEPSVSTAQQEAEHVYTNIYENVYIPLRKQDVDEINQTMIPNTDGSFKASECKELQHIYENVDLDEKVTDNEGKIAGYERIYAGEARDSLSTLVGDIEAPGIGNRVTTSRFKNSISNTAMVEKKLVVGFSTEIDDFSEDELNKYLTKLEAEERAIEGTVVYENVGTTYNQPREDGTLRQVIATSRKHATVDEDANEAPIFETVTIGVLPLVSEEKLQEKAKQFPVIDYSKQPGSSSGMDPKSSDFLDNNVPKQYPAHTRTISEAREMEERCGEAGNTENQENIGPRLSVPDTMGKVIFTGEVVENIPLNYDSSDITVNNDSSKDSASNGIDVGGNNAANANVEFECNRVAEEATKNDCVSGNGERSNTLVFTEINMKPNTAEDCGHSNNENGISEFPKSLENGFGNNNESAKGEERCNADNKPSRPHSLDIASSVSTGDNMMPGFPGVSPSSHERLEADGDAPQQIGDHSQDVSDNYSFESGTILGKQPPFWIPDNEAPNCMLCDVRFTVIKRRHHCRACGKVLCNKCCSMKYRLEYQGNIDSRVCSPCYQLIVKAEQEHGSSDGPSTCANSSPSNIISSQGRQPNPNNPMEYCSTIPPLQQLAEGLPAPPTVMVPVGVLKREGSSKQRPEGQKSVMFSDGIRPGCDLTELDTSWDLKPSFRKMGKRTATSGAIPTLGRLKRQNIPPMDPNTNCYIPHDPDTLPPTVTIHKGEISYHESMGPSSLYESLKNECEPPIMFAINRNLYAYVKITNLSCCVNRICWNITSRGLACVGQDEIILLVETLPDETQIPKDLLIHINQIYIEAIKGNTITELGISIHHGGHFLGSREHAGFLFIRQSFQCLQKIILPPAPFLVGLLVHRWETPWAKVFPLRLMLRLGAEYRYYPCPLVSVRFRDAVYFEIGHTIMKVLADFRNFAYTLPGVRGLTIHMQDRRTDVLFPKNRYDQVIKGLNNSNDHVLAFASNFSIQSDSHLVCIQTNTGDESSYQTQAINIHNKPRKVTGASFVVINGALKSSMGLSAKSSIIEDGLMVQIMPEKMEALKASLKNMHDFSIGCGLQGAPEPDEIVNIKWVDNDVQFNSGVKSPIDGKAMDGIPSIRVHNGTDYIGTSRLIRWTEVFIIKSDDHPVGVHDPVDINKLSESIARATCTAFVKLLDLLVTAGLSKLAVRTTIHPDNVGYEAGSEGTRLPPIYMNSLDNELIQVLHKAAQISQDTNTVLELIFHVLDD